MENDGVQQSTNPNLNLFDMPRVHKQKYWAFVKLVAPSDTLPPGRTQWTSSEATSAYCTKCKFTFPYKSGTSAGIRKHLMKDHPEVLLQERGEMSRDTASKMVVEAIASKRKSAAAFLSPTKRSKKVAPAKEEMATRQIVEWICTNLQPLSIVEDEELSRFTVFVQLISGLYELPSRRTITDRLQTYAQQQRNEMQVAILATALFFCITTDIWTSRAAESFLAMIIHFVTEHFKMTSYTLEVTSFPGKHSGTRIADMLRGLMLKWGLGSSRLTKVVRDNGSNEMGVDHFGCIARSLHLVVAGALSKTREQVDEIAVVQAQGVSLDDLSDPEPGEEFWEEDPAIEIEAINDLEEELDLLGLEGSSCGESFDDSVDLIADDSLDEGVIDGRLSSRAVTQLMDAMKQAMSETQQHVSSFRKIVIFFRKCAKAKSKLKTLQKIAQPLTVIADVATRWNSTHAMLKRLLELRSPLLEFLEYIQTSVGKEEFSDIKISRPTGEMWFHIQCLDKLLVSFDGMTKLLYGERYATMPLILSSLRLLEARLKNRQIFAKVACGHEGEPYHGTTRRRMHLVRRLFLLPLRKRYGNLPDDVKSCCLLDPQFAHGKYLTTEEKEAAELFLANEAMRLAGADVVDSDLNISVEIASDDEDDFVGELLGLTRKPRAPEPESQEELSLRDKIKTELKLYLDKCALLDKARSQGRTRDKTKPKNQTQLENPLKWWGSNAVHFPFLGPVVRKYFGVVATSVPSERCFSSAGNAVTARRSRLTGDNVRDIVLLHDNTYIAGEESDDDNS